MSGVQSSDSGPQLAPSSSGSASPRPPFTQSQPRMPGPRPAVAGYWPYDGRAVPAWGPVVGAPVRYMMDPRSYMWHMSQGGNTPFIARGIVCCVMLRSSAVVYVYFRYFSKVIILPFFITC